LRLTPIAERPGLGPRGRWRAVMVENAVLRGSLRWKGRW